MPESYCSGLFMFTHQSLALLRNANVQWVSDMKKAVYVQGSLSIYEILA